MYVCVCLKGAMFKLKSTFSLGIVASRRVLDFIYRVSLAQFC